MSAGRRKQWRVQGGWSAARRPANSTTPLADKRNSSQTPAGALLHGKSFRFQDPKQLVMAGECPPRFSWVVPGVLAGCALPSLPDHLHYMIHAGVRHLVTLTEWKPNVSRACPNLNHVHMPIEEFEAPTVKQAQEFVEFVIQAKSRQEGVAVHCHWGLGRTGTMIACFLVKDNGLAPKDAIRTVRQCRPYSIETEEQERLVYDYHDLISAPTTMNAQCHNGAQAS